MFFLIYSSFVCKLLLQSSTTGCLMHSIIGFSTIATGLLITLSTGIPLAESYLLVVCFIISLGFSIIGDNFFTSFVINVNGGVYFFNSKISALSASITLYWSITVFITEPSDYEDSSLLYAYLYNKWYLEDFAHSLRHVWYNLSYSTRATVSADLTKSSFLKVSKSDCKVIICDSRVFLEWISLRRASFIRWCLDEARLFGEVSYLHGDIWLVWPVLFMCECDLDL